ncbi:MAG: hypothetical protein WC543_00915 [Candidatus Omnitrophota bacterium]
MLKRLIKGQSTAEYAIVIGLVIAAAVAMQVFVKRQLQGKMKNVTDAEVAANKDGDTFGVNEYLQYEPQETYSQGAMVSESESEVKVTTTKGGAVTRSMLKDEVSSRTGTQIIEEVK